MVIKVSTLLAHNTKVIDDPTPTLGGPLNTNGFLIANGSNSVTISGNNYPTNTGTSGQVLTTNGSGILYWATAGSGSGSVTSVGLTSSGTTITISGTPNPITSTGTFNIDLPNTGVIATTYGSASSVGAFTVDSKGRITSASTAPISITPSQAGLGSVANQLQVINSGGAPNIAEGSGNPIGTNTLGAIYIDRAVTNGNGIYYYNGTTWVVVATKPNLYAEKVNGYIVPVAAALDSVAIGSGAETASTAQGSLAIGLQSLARTQGGVVQASGRFASNGDAQTGRYLLRGTTISVAPQELLIDGTGGNIRLTLPDDATWTFRITITAHRTDLGNGHAGYTAAGVIFRGAGAATTTIQGSIQKTVLAESNPSWDINISADTTNGSLRITVTGENSKTIRWLALVETVEITN